MSGDQLRRWWVPLLVSANLLAILLFVFPIGGGYTTVSMPLAESLWSIWTTASESAQDSTYCLLVLPIVAYLVFTRRTQLVNAPVRGSTAAICWILAGLFLFWIGSRAGKQLIGEAGLQILILGIILWFWGTTSFRVLAFAWIFLLFAWPMPFMDALVAFPLRMGVSDLTYHLLNLVGIPCIKHGTALLSAPDEGTGLQLGSRFRIDIADPCSGIHSLMALLMFSALYGYLFLPRLWQQWTLFVSAVPLIVIGNLVRIFLLVAGSIVLGTDMALGTDDSPSWYHEGCGYTVFVVVLGLEVLLAKGLMYLAGGTAKGATSAKDPRNNEAVTRGQGATDTDVPWWRSGVVLALTFGMLLIHTLGPEHYGAPEEGVVMTLPDRVELPESNGQAFHGTPAPIYSSERRLLPTDTEYARKEYDDGHGNQIYFSIILSGLYQSFGYSLHPPEVCLVGQGWHLDTQRDLTVRLNSGHGLKLRCLRITRESSGSQEEGQAISALYMYWYVAKNVVTTSRSTLYWWNTWDRLVHNHDPRWASMTLMMPITQTIRHDGLTEEETSQKLQEFIRQVAPATMISEMPDPTTP